MILVQIQIWILDLHWKKWIWIQMNNEYFFRICYFFNKAELSYLFFSSFLLIFMPRLNEPFRYQEIFIISPVSTVQICVFRVNKFFAVWLIFYSLDPPISADHDPGSQNLADPTDLALKHWFKGPELKTLEWDILSFKDLKASQDWKTPLITLLKLMTG